MGGEILKRIFLLLGLFAASFAAFSINRDIRFEEVNADNSLPQNMVLAIHQDNLGFMWLGTINGLHKYDGYTFKDYRFTANTEYTTSSSSHSNRVVNITEDSNGKLWLNTYDGRMHRFDPATETYTSFPLGDDDFTITTITHFFESETGIICLSTSNKGIYILEEDSVSGELKVNHIFNEEGKVPILSSNNVNFVAEDTNHDFWIGTDNGLNKVEASDLFLSNPNSRHYFASSVNNPKRFTSNCFAHQGELLWFGTEEHGLVCYDADRDLFNRFVGSSVFSKLSEDRLVTMIAKGNLLWIGTNNGEIILYDKAMGEFSKHKLPAQYANAEIRQLKVDYRDQLWIITNEFGIIRFDSEYKRFKSYRLTPEELETFTDYENTEILEDSKGMLWLGVHNVGIQLYDRVADKFIRYSYDPIDRSSLRSNVVECLFEDREGTIWVGTSTFGKGLSKIISTDPDFLYVKPLKFQTNRIQNIIRSLHHDSYGYLWAGSKSGKVYIYDTDLKLVSTLEKNVGKNFTGHNVYSIKEDKKGHIWLATKGGGLFKSKQTVKMVFPRYDKLTFENFSYAKENENSLINNNSCYDMAFDKWDRLWVATYGGGLNMIDFRSNPKGESTFFTSKNSGVSGDKTRDICIDNNGRMWLGTTYGLNYLDLYEKATIDSADISKILVDDNKENNLTYNDIAMVTESSKGEIWLATIGGGINVITNPKEKNFRIKSILQKDGLSGNIVYSILEDNKGKMWIGTEYGLSIYEPLNDRVLNFGKKQGLPEIFFSESTCALSPQGTKIFGTVNGFYVIKKDITENLKKPSAIYFTSFQLYNKEVSPAQASSPLTKSITYTKALSLKHFQSNFALEFASMSFLAPESNQFMYKLDGFEEVWNMAGTDHKATYTNVPPGDYVFKVRSANNDTTSDISEATLRIKILPIFWRSRNAFILYIIFILIVLFVVLRVTIRMTRLKNNVLVEHRVAESKLRFFTNISHEFRTPLTLILGPVESLIKRKGLPDEVTGDLDIVYKNTQRLLRMVNQLLDFRKVMNDKVELKVQEIKVLPFLENLGENFNEFAERKGIDFKVTCLNPDLRLWGDIQKLDIVVFNLLSNAFKFTPAQKSIEVEVTESDKKEFIYIKVKDSGVGIDEDKLPYIFNRFYVSNSEADTGFDGAGIGLSLCKEYVNLHKGEVAVESAKGEGTTFVVKLKQGNEHFPANIIQYNPKPVTSQIKEVLLDENDLGKDPDLAIEEPQNGLPVVLVVEDDLDMGSYIKGKLSEYFKVHIAQDGEEGLEMALKTSPDLIVTDIMMPKMNGIDMTKNLKENFETSHIPIIMLTAKSEVENQVEGLGIGAEAYIPKPFNFSVLLSYVNSILEQRKIIKARFDNVVELKPDEVRVQPKDKIFIEKVVALIEENMSDSDFNVEKLAGMLNVSRTLFYKKIKNITGFQPIELIRSLRLKKAALLLETGDYNITEVAYMLGYNDIRYFSTTFKKQYGKSPSIYQKEFKKNILGGSE